MINDIINGVAAAIREEFGENVKIYAGQVSGSLEKPCFFVLSDGGGLELYRGKRYYAKNRIIVNFMGPMKLGRPPRDFLSVLRL